MGNQCQTCQNQLPENNPRDDILADCHNETFQQTPDKNITSQKLIESITTPKKQQKID